MTTKVPVPKEIFASLTALADNGDSFPDYQTMKKLAAQQGLRTTEHWLHNNMKLYQQIRLNGAEPAD